MYFKIDSLEWIFYVTIKTVQSLQSPTKVLALLHTFPVSFKAIYQFVPLPPIQCCLSWWSCHCSFPTLSGGRRFLIPVMPLVIVSKITCQRMFQLSDPGVPRTFVEDCSFTCKNGSGLKSYRMNAKQHTNKNGAWKTFYGGKTPLSFHWYPKRRLSSYLV